MASLGGKHTQARTGRVISYWCTYGPTAAGMVFVAPVFAEGMRTFDSEDFELPLAPEATNIPIEVRVRDALLRRIDTAEFGEGRLPDPRWIGWHGKLL